MRRLSVLLLAGVLGLLGCRGQTVSQKYFRTRANAACAAGGDAHP
jgi:hypothetical protein